MTRCDRTGQISVDYLGGALIFFSAVIVLVSSVAGTVPQFRDTQQLTSSQLEAWSISEVLMQDQGYWQNATGQGTEWYVGNRTKNTTLLGLSDGDGIDRDRLEALITMEYSEARAALDVDSDFNMLFTEFVTVDTHRTFQQNGPGAPDQLVEPVYGPGEADTVHYGTRLFNDSQRIFLLTDELGWYNRLRVSPNWDFTDGNTQTYNLTDPRFFVVNERAFRMDAAHTQISDGKLLVLQHRIGRAGTVPGSAVQDIVSVTRYGVMDGRIVQMVLQLWD